MTKIDAYLAVFDDPATAARRADADNQRDNWLRQMELAQMAEMGRGAPAQGGQPAALRSGWAPLQAGAALAHPAARAAAATPQHQDSTTGPARAHDGAAGDAPAAEQQAAGQQHEPGSTPAGDDKDAGATDAALPQSIAPAATLAAPPALAQSIAPAATLAAPPALAGAAPSGPAASAQQGTPLVAPLVARAALPAALPPRAAAEAETHEAPAADAAPDAEQPDWHKRMLHLTGQGDDVAVWIRDQELTPAQSQLLLARVAADVAGMGLRLKGATINGKPVLRGGVAEQDHPAAASDDQAPLIHPTTEQQHVSR